MRIVIHIPGDGGFDSLSEAEQEYYLRLSREHEVVYLNHGKFVHVLDLTTDADDAADDYQQAMADLTPAEFQRLYRNNWPTKDVPHE